MSETLSELIHKRKVAKEKQMDKSQLPYVQMDKSTNGECSMAVNTDLDTKDGQSSILQENKRVLKSRNQQVLQSAEIDEYLTGLVMDDIIDPQFTAWVAKCCFMLGVPMVNRLVISARSGRDSKKLLAYKLKSAMQLHAKRSFFAAEQGIVGERG